MHREGNSPPRNQGQLPPDTEKKSKIDPKDLENYKMLESKITSRHEDLQVGVNFLDLKLIIIYKPIPYQISSNFNLMGT